MADDTAGLDPDERAELEQLRAEKAARQELEQLRAEKAARERARQSSARERQEAQRIQAARERGKKLMEPDDDLSMPLGQKIVLIGIAVVVVAMIAVFLLGPQ